MKFLRLLLFVIMAGILFTSCQKEFSAETGSAQGVLVKDAAGDCTASVNGAYKKDTLLTAANFVDVQINFTQLGVYIISTDTVNGYYFRASGVAAITGLNTVRLFGTGKPIATGTDNFIVSYAGSTCDFATTVTIGTGGGGTTTAVFTFANTGAACTGAVQTPNFYVGLPTTSITNTITLFVNVTNAGTYTLTTTPANGLIFSGSGSLSVGNNQPIVLGASGPPTAAGIFPYTFSTTTPASSCGFDLTVQTAPTPAAFTFNCAAVTFAGTYQVGTGMTTGNTMTVPITVTTGGGYAITTTVNGVTFANAGILPATPAAQTITLAATGTPTAAATPSTVFTLTGGGGASCPITIPFTTGGGGGTDFLKAKINGSTTFTNFTLILDAILTNGSPSSLEISGDAVSGETFLLGLDRLTPIATNVVYNINDFLTGTVITVDYEDPTLVLYNTTPINIVTADPFKITITSITATRIEGTFSGSVEEDMPAGATPLIKKFTEGSFSLQLP